MLEAGASQVESPCGAGGRAAAITAGSRARNKKYNRFIRLNLELESLPRQSAARASRTALEQLQGWRWQGVRDGPGAPLGAPSQGSPSQCPSTGLWRGAAQAGPARSVMGVQLPCEAWKGWRDIQGGTGRGRRGAEPRERPQLCPTQNGLCTAYSPAQRAAELLDAALSSLQSQLGLLALSEEIKSNVKLVPLGPPSLHTYSAASGTSAALPLHGPDRCSGWQNRSSLALSQALLSLQPMATSTAQVSGGAHPHSWIQIHGKGMAGTSVVPAQKQWLRPFPEQGNANTQPKPETRGSSRGSRRKLAKSSLFLAPSGPWLLQPSALVSQACSSCCIQGPATLSSAQQRPGEGRAQALEPPVLLHTRLPQLPQLQQQVLQPHRSAARLV